MENPATWGEAEKVIQRVHQDWLENLHKPAGERVIGLSLYRQVADALREAGLLEDGD